MCPQIAIRSDHPAECSSYDANKSEQSSKTSSAIASGLNSLPATLFSAIGSYTMNSRWVNSVRNSVGNIKAHYDISNRMFASFLSDDVSPCRLCLIVWTRLIVVTSDSCS